jgi:hypothetical protein
MKLTPASFLSIGLVTLASAAQAQSAAPTESMATAPQPSTASASPLKDMGPYAGTSRADFYDPAERIAQLRANLKLGRLGGRAAQRVSARLSAISQELKARIARHSDGLRDWDRELINEKLDAVVKQYPTLAS